MGSRGPAPKRDAERRRRNTTATRSVQMAGVVEAPSLATRAGWAEGMHQLAQDWYYSLARSGQSYYYEPSDWELARVIAWKLSSCLTNPNAKAADWGIVLTGMAKLAVSEVDRRRAEIEVERMRDASPEQPKVSAMAEYRRQRGKELAEVPE